MFQTSKIKLVVLAFIYVLHVAFFDGLMAHSSTSNAVSLFSYSHQGSSKSNVPVESSYRLLLKHEQAKQAMVSLPDAFNFISATFTGFVEPLMLQARPGFFSGLNECTFKLFRLFLVFRI